MNEEESISFDNWPTLNKVTFNYSSIFNFFKNLPIICIFLFIMIYPLLIILQNSSNKINQFIQLRDALTLQGVQIQPQPPNWSIQNFMNKSWQSQVDSWLYSHLPFRNAIIRTHNQIYYSLFSKSYMENQSILIGKKNYLYEIDYLQSYCNPAHTQYSQATFNQWAHNVEKLTQFFKNRGQAFIYVNSPSKARYYPEYYPIGFPCSTTQKRPAYMMAMKALSHTPNIHYVDSSKILLNAKQRYGHLLFPKSGIHWTLLGATLAAQEIIKQISSTTSYHLPPLEFSYTRTLHPTTVDWTNVDLLSLMNLLTPQIDFVVPDVKIKPMKHIHKKLKLAIIGDSFSNHLSQALINTHAFSKIDFYSYFTLGHAQFHPQKMGFTNIFPQLANLSTVDANDSKTYEDIFKADVVIFEDNESMLISNHFKLFLNAILKPKTP